MTLPIHCVSSDTRRCVNQLVCIEFSRGLSFNFYNVTISYLNNFFLYSNQYYFNEIFNYFSSCI